MIRSTCSKEPLIGSRTTDLGRHSWSPAARPSRRSSVLAPPFFRAISRSWLGRDTCTGGVPWPYRTAGTLLARRTRRAAPLPNSVRGSAAIRTSDTAVLSSLRLRGLTAAGRVRDRPPRERLDWARSLAKRQSSRLDPEPETGSSPYG